MPAGLCRVSTSPGFGLSDRRSRPRPLRSSQGLKRLRHSEHAEVVEAAADDLYSDWKALLVIATIDRDGGVFRHVPRNGIGDVLERFFGIVERGGEFGGEF